MDQHPIPQDITGFKFKLVGDMTLKQFGYLAAGSIVAWIFYSTPWYPIIKFTLAFLAFVAGVAFAFLPIEDRPMEVWVSNFFKSIYKPTFLIWKKDSAAAQTETPLLSEAFPKLKMPSREHVLPNFPLKPPAPPPSPNVPVPPTPTPVVAPEPPTDSTLSTTPTSASSTIDELEKIRAQKIAQLEETRRTTFSEKPLTEPAEPNPSEIALNPVLDVEALEQMRIQAKVPTMGQNDPVVIQKDKELAALMDQDRQLQKQVEQIRGKTMTLSGVEKETLEKTLAEIVKSQGSLGLQIATLQKALVDLKTAAAIENNKPVAPPPPPPRPIQTLSLTQIPNVISGLVRGPKGEPMLGAIVLIKDQAGNAIRALKTNKVGQFITNTPLENGAYQVEIEKEGVTYAMQPLTLTGQVMPVLEINPQANGSI